MTIICVDPSPVALVRLRMQIRKIHPDAEIKCCRSSKEALEAARRIGGRRSCDILITDIDLGSGRGDGLQLAEELKKLFPNINIIFASGAPEWYYAALILKMRVSGYLVKPFSADDLREELCNLRYKPDIGKPEVSL